VLVLDARPRRPQSGAVGALASASWPTRTTSELSSSGVTAIAVGRVGRPVGAQQVRCWSSARRLSFDLLLLPLSTMARNASAGLIFSWVVASVLCHLSPTDATCASVVCRRGLAKVPNASGSTEATCCACPAGTVDSYKNQYLVLQLKASQAEQLEKMTAGVAAACVGLLSLNCTRIFASSNDTTSASCPSGCSYTAAVDARPGSLRWNATVPSNLTFSTNNNSIPPDPMGLGPALPIAMTRVVTAPWTDMPDGVEAGVEFGRNLENGNCLFSDKKVAVGAENTLIVRGTDSVGPQIMFGTLASFRAGDGPGGFGWMVANIYGHTLAVDDWAPSGFSGPVVAQTATENSTYVPQYYIFRTSMQIGPLGGLVPVVEMAVVSTTPPFDLQWTSTRQAAGLTEYSGSCSDTALMNLLSKKQIEQLGLKPPGVSSCLKNEVFDFDWRSPSDADAALGAGYMQLGHWAIGSIYEGITFYRGIMHHLELHNIALPDTAIRQVLSGLHAGTGLADPACNTCGPGFSDNDNDGATPCAACTPGTFSDTTGSSGECTQTCGLGSTIFEAGAASNATCTQCQAGYYGDTGISASRAAASTVTLCAMCPPGRFSTEVGATSIATCQPCPDSQFSGHGASSCQPSGCTDNWATNYNADAIVDNGECVYTCNRLREQRGITTMKGGCLIHMGNNIGWQRFLFNGTAVAGGIINILPLDEHWILHGRNLPGSTQTAPLYIEYAEECDLLNPVTYETRNATQSRMKCATAPCTQKGLESTAGRPMCWGGVYMKLGSELSMRSLSMTNKHHYVFPNEPGSTSTGALIRPDTTDIFPAQVWLCRIYAADNVANDAGVAGFGPGTNFTLIDVRMDRNTGHQHSGALGLYHSDNTFYASHSHFEGNKGGEYRLDSGYGGCLGTGGTGTIATIKFSLFASNVAGFSGGAIMQLAGGAMTLETVAFQKNKASVGADIHSTTSAVDIHASDFFDSYGSGKAQGQSVFFDSPTNIKLLDVMFQPLAPAATTVWIAGLTGGCDRHPCDPGSQCSYSNYSLSCTPCKDTEAATSVSTDGLICLPCPAGMGPSIDRTHCQLCTGNTFSTVGVCQRCPDTQKAKDDHTSCEDCGADETALATANSSTTVHSCVCADSYYNASTLHVCFWSSYDEDALSTAFAQRERNAASSDCDACPMDAKQNPCLFCKGGDLMIAPGFTAPPIANPDSGAGGHISVFRCHVDMKIGRKRCPGTRASANRRILAPSASMNPQCAEGYAGHICGECQNDWGMNTDRVCEPCEESGFTPAAILAILGILLGVGLLLVLAARLWESFNLKHLLRCSVQPARILITYSQVTSQLGDVLNFV
jgi:hypothetical protein